LAFTPIKGAFEGLENSKFTAVESAPYKPTELPEQDEREFSKWYGEYAVGAGLDPNPDAPEHAYDY